MKTRLLQSVFAFGLLAPAAPAFSQSLQAFRWFADLAGSCWTGPFPDGKTRHKQCYSVQYGKFLRGTASLIVEQEGASRAQFEGDSVFAWDTASGQITYYIWGSDGSHRQLAAQFVGDELVFPVPSRKAPSEIAYRSVWRRISADVFEVRRERPAGGAWSTELTVVYKRERSE